MQELNKAAMGKRIRQIRLGARLRQWELAKLLGTTQSAVHKYEHGVVPEPRRLVELARIGGTSIEWVLTGRHWENGSDEQQRVSPELLDTACILREVSDEGRATVHEALGILRDAVRALERQETTGRISGEDALQAHSATTLQLLESAWQIQQAVLRRVSEDARERLGLGALMTDRRPPKGQVPERDEPAAGRSRS